MKLKKHDLCQKSALYFLAGLLLMSIFCGYVMAEQGLPRNSSEAMAELERIKRGEAPSGGGMGRDDFMKMIDKNYTQDDKKIFCDNNLIKIRSAKESYMNDNLDRLNQMNEITKEQIDQYINGGMASLACKSGGEYIIEGIAAMPECSVHGRLQ